MLIREAKKEDLNDVISLFKVLDEYHRESVPNTFKVISYDFRKDYFFKCLESDINFFVVAEQNDEVIGFIDASMETINNNPMAIDKQYMNIENLIVDEKYRKQGIAKQLFEYIKDIAKKMNLDYIKLGVHEFNGASIFMKI